MSGRKILVYSDVHGNLLALEKLMKSRDYKSADLRIFLGDAVMMGPKPKECLERIFESGDIFILGNHDRYTAYGLPKDMICKKDKIEHQSFMRNKIPFDFKEKIKLLPKELYLELGGKKLYFTHYLWKSEEDVEDELEGDDLTAENLDKIFSKIDADIIFHGHDHYPSHFVSKNKEYYIVGSLGIKIPAKYIVILEKNNKLKIKHKTLRYNYRKVISEMHKMNYTNVDLYVSFFKH